MSHRYRQINMNTPARMREFLEDDSGLAMTTVMAISAILFILVTTLLVLSSNLVLGTQRQAASTKAVHMADAGLNAYLYELRRNPTFYLSTPSLGPTVLDDGVWTVTAAGSGSPGAPVDLTAVGAIPGLDTTRTIYAQVRFPTYAEYMFLVDADISIGTEALILGSIRANGDIENKGAVTGDALAAGVVVDTAVGTASDSLPRGIRGTASGGQSNINFDQVSVDMNLMKETAKSSSTYYAGSGASGYEVVMRSDNTVAIYKVTGGTTSGNLSTSLIGTVAVPSSGVLYFDDKVWVRGTYSTKLTIVSGSDSIWINGNIEPSDLGSVHICGLIAQDSVIVPSWYPLTPQFPQDVEVVAALLAQKGKVEADMQTGAFRNSIRILGSMAYSEQGGFVSVNTWSGAQVAGFRERTYEYDERLEVEPPPYYPRLRDGTLKVSTWFSQG
ncbi:MAG: hypothetical protein RBS17_07355 [Coriobacteriia bacterium]|nr:hypothetical protein [Coriobacteriia bacterium]